MTDLNEELLSEFEIKKYPRLAVSTYNFEEQKHEIAYYQSSDFSDDEYYDVKAFF